MNAKPTALDAYLARTAAIHAKLELLQQLANDHFGHDPDAIHRARVGTPGGQHRADSRLGRRCRTSLKTGYLTTGKRSGK